VPWPVGTVDQQNVLPAVAIVVEEGASGAKGFREEFAAEGSTVVLKLNSRPAGHIDESKAGKGRGLRR